MSNKKKKMLTTSSKRSQICSPNTRALKSLKASIQTKWRKLKVDSENEKTLLAFDSLNNKRDLSEGRNNRMSQTLTSEEVSEWQIMHQKMISKYMDAVHLTKMSRFTGFASPNKLRNKLMENSFRLRSPQPTSVRQRLQANPKVNIGRWVRGGFMSPTKIIIEKSSLAEGFKDQTLVNKFMNCSAAW